MPKVIDTQMRYPDSSSFTWRTKLATASMIDKTKHSITQVFDPNPAPSMRNKAVLSFVGTGFGGRVQDASSYTITQSVRALGQDNFTGGRIQTSGVRADGSSCLATPAPSIVVSELYGNADFANVLQKNGTILRDCGPPATGPTNMSWKAYTGTHLSTTYLSSVPGAGPAMCNEVFKPQTKSHFVDTQPAIKLHKVGVLPRGSLTGDGRSNFGAQETVVFPPGDTSYTKGTIKDSQGNVVAKDIVPVLIHSAVPYNPEFAKLIFAPTGPQSGGGYLPGSRAPKVGGASPPIKRGINHRGWASPLKAVPRIKSPEKGSNQPPTPPFLVRKL